MTDDLVKRLRARAEYCEDQPPNVQMSWNPANTLWWQAADALEEKDDKIERLMQWRRAMTDGLEKRVERLEKYCEALDAWFKAQKRKREEWFDKHLPGIEEWPDD